MTAPVAALTRVPLMINMLAVWAWSRILVAEAAGICTPTLLRGWSRSFPTSLLLDSTTDQFLRVAATTCDVGPRRWWLPVQAELSLAICSAAWLASSRTQAEPTAEKDTGFAGGLAVGAHLFLETSLLGFPYELARWISVDCAIVVPLLMAVTISASFVVELALP